MGKGTPVLGGNELVTADWGWARHRQRCDSTEARPQPKTAEIHAPAPAQELCRRTRLEILFGLII